jgi:hypothetical protein
MVPAIPFHPGNAVAILEARFFFAYFSVGQPHLSDGYLAKFSSESITDKLQDGRGFSGENKDVVGSRCVNCCTATLIRARPKISRSLIERLIIIEKLVLQS